MGKIILNKRLPFLEGNVGRLRSGISDPSLQQTFAWWQVRPQTLGGPRYLLETATL